MKSALPMSPSKARVVFVFMFLAFSAPAVGVFLQLRADNTWMGLAMKGLMLAVLAYNVKVLVDAFQRVKEVEIESIVQCLPWRLAAAKRRQAKD